MLERFKPLPEDTIRVTSDSLKDAIVSLKNAFEKNILDDPINNPKYYNMTTVAFSNSPLNTGAR